MQKLGYLAGFTSVLLVACSPQAETPNATVETAETGSDAVAETQVEENEVPDETAAGLPETDIAVAEITWVEGLPEISTPRVWTAQGVYDNQPAFDERGGFYFTTETPGNQTDIRYMSPDGTVSVFTGTPDESEYSPRPSPDNRSVTYIHQAPGDVGGQVFRTAYDGSSSGPIHEYGPSGYYALSGDQAQMLLFALTDPFTLRLANNETGTEQAITSEPGRALYSSPDGASAYFTLAHPDSGFVINQYSFADGSIEEVFRLPGESQDYAVFLNPEGQLSWFAVSEGTLLYRDSDHDDWQPVTDLAEMGFTGISRLAVSLQADRLAIVVEE